MASGEMGKALTMRPTRLAALKVRRVQRTAAVIREPWQVLVSGWRRHVEHGVGLLGARVGFVGFARVGDCGLAWQTD
jgi:hypothetical protein